MASASRLLHLARLPTAAAASSRLLRPLAAAGSLLPAAFPSSPAHPSPARGRFFSTQQANSSLRDTSPNWSNRPPKETILLDGCDFEHWLVVLEPPPGDAANPEPTRDEIIDGYIKTLAEVVGSEEEARLKIYSVSTRHYFAFGALVSEEVSYKLKELPKVRWVLPDSYLDVIKKDYGGEPFINGEAVPYDPKYHEEWVRNNARANERSRRNDRPRNFDRSKNFERRRENMQNFQNRDAPPNQGFNSQPPPGQGFNSPPPGPGFNSTPPPGQNPVPPRDVPPMRPPPGNMPPPPAQQNAGYNYQQGGSPGYQNGPPGYQAGNQGYQGNPGGPVPAYQSNNPGYQGGGPGYQGGNQPPPQSGIPPPYNQGVNPGYGNGGAPGYQGQGGNPSYQQGSNNYNGGPPAYESDAPGRRYQ